MGFDDVPRLKWSPAGYGPAMQAILVRELGGPEVLVPAEVPDPVAGADSVLVQVSAAGINYADTHRTEGSYRVAPTLPFIPGTEVVGQDPDGRRVLGLNFDGGGYAEQAVVPAHQVVPVPDGVSDGAALALIVQGLTAWHVLRNCARLRPGESVVVNAAAGGVGSLAVQLARQFGAGRVIATASTVDKCELARELGADVAVDGAAEGYADRIWAANDGHPVDVVLEATGGPVFTAALDSLATFGRLITYGNASRLGRPLVDPAELGSRTIGVLGFWLRPVVDRPDGYGDPLVQLLQLAAQGSLRPVVGPGYPLAEARRAHEDLLARRSTGKLILLP